MCFPIGVGMKESTTKDYKVINEEIFNPIEKKKEVQHYTCRDIISDIIQKRCSLMVLMMR